MALSLGLAGCTVGNPYRAPAMVPVVLASPQAAAFAQQVEAPPDWWGFLEDAQLSALIAQALAHNHDIRQAQASLQASRAVFDARTHDQSPQVGVRAGYQRSVGPQTDASGTTARAVSYQTRLGFDAQWEIDLFGRLGRLSAAALARAEAAQATVALVQLTVAAEVARAYYEAQGADDGLAVARAQVQSWRDTLALLDARIAAGTGLPEEQENARANLRRSEAALAPWELAVAQARYRLDILTGQPPGHHATMTPVRTAAPLARTLPLGDVGQLLRARPDVRAAERLLAASVEDVGAATANLYPRLDLGAFIGFLALGGSDIGSAARVLDLAPSLYWPALRLGGVRAQIREARALSDGALARYEQTLLAAQEEVELAVTQLVQYQTRLVSLAEAAQHAVRASDIAQARYQAGAGDYLAVLENQRALFEIQQALVAAQAASYLHVVALYQALGWGASEAADGMPEVTHEALAVAGCEASVCVALAP